LPIRRNPSDCIQLDTLVEVIPNAVDESIVPTNGQETTR
jgi:hypothetical protein